MGFFDFFKKADKPNYTPDPLYRVDKQAVNPAAYGGGNAFDGVFFDMFAGDKFPGGFGYTKSYAKDLHSLRARSKQLFTENEYAIAVIRRLVTNIVNTGFKLQAHPDQELTGLDDEQENQWTRGVEKLWRLYTEDRELINHERLMTISELEAQCLQTAIISGDCLVVLRVDPDNGMPTIQLVDGANVMSAYDASPAKGHEIKDGVEFDSDGRQVAYWVKSGTGTNRVAAYGGNSGRRVAWLVHFGTKNVNEVRGTPLLSAILQALKEIDRYKDSEQRAAVLNSTISTWLKRDPEAKPSNTSFGRLANRDDELVGNNSDSTTTTTKSPSMMPGAMVDTLAPGEELRSFDTTRPNVNFKDFVKAILAGVAFSMEIPPEVLFLEFQNSYSAARQAGNEFKMFLNMARANQAARFNHIYYKEFLVYAALSGKIEAAAYVDALLNPKKWDEANAWSMAKWIGAARPSIDLLKDVNAYVKLDENGLVSKQDIAQELRASDYDEIVRRRSKEQKKLDLLNANIENENDAAQSETPARSLIGII